MGVIVLYDKSIPRDISKADVAMGIGASDDIKIKIEELATLIQRNPKTAILEWSNVLHIVCNGTPGGLQLGQLINHNNVAKIFLPLRFKVGSIIIHGCDAALIYRAANNGFLMCQKLANIVFANVTASNISSYSYTSQKNEAYGKWHGKVATWNQFGKIRMLQEYNNEGGFMRNIHEPLHSVIKYFKSTVASVQNKKYLIKHPVVAGRLKRFFNLHYLFTAKLFTK